MSNAAIGTATADGAIYVAKAIFAPKTLPATKGDVEALKLEIQNLKFLLRAKSAN
ncbi:hypothetical protein [Bizionia arctica]|nr:hypothetical protein [Bizionia arctica]